MGLNKACWPVSLIVVFLLCLGSVMPVWADTDTPTATETATETETPTATATMTATATATATLTSTVTVTPTATALPSPAGSGPNAEMAGFYLIITGAWAFVYLLVFVLSKTKDLAFTIITIGFCVVALATQSYEGAAIAYLLWLIFTTCYWALHALYEAFW